MMVTTNNKRRLNTGFLSFFEAIYQNKDWNAMILMEGQSLWM